jgi:hypothetical protein
MRQILQDQQKRIINTLSRHESKDAHQLTLGFDEAERRQLEADQRYWRKRLTRLEREIMDQPQRIADLYRIQAQRIEPIGVVYLMPGGA